MIFITPIRYFQSITNMKQAPDVITLKTPRGKAMWACVHLTNKRIIYDKLIFISFRIHKKKSMIRCIFVGLHWCLCLLHVSPPLFHPSTPPPLHPSIPPSLHPSTPPPLHPSTPPPLHPSTPPSLHPFIPSPLYPSTPLIFLCCHPSFLVMHVSFQLLRPFTDRAYIGIIASLHLGIELCIGKVLAFHFEKPFSSTWWHNHWCELARQLVHIHLGPGWCGCNSADWCGDVDPSGLSGY